jgi:hypothetical protein
MDGSHTVGMCKYKAKYSFFLRCISLIFLGRFWALNFAVLRSIHRDCTLRTKVDLRSSVSYFSRKDMNEREIYADMNDTLGAYCIGYSTVTKYLKKKCLISMLDMDFEPKIEEENFINKAILGALEECHFPSVRQIAKRIFIPMSTVRNHLVNSLGYPIRNIRWVHPSLSSSRKQARIEMGQDLPQVLRLVKHHDWKYRVFHIEVSISVSQLDPGSKS